MIRQHDTPDIDTLGAFERGCCWSATGFLAIAIDWNVGEVAGDIYVLSSIVPTNGQGQESWEVHKCAIIVISNRNALQIS